MTELTQSMLGPDSMLAHYRILAPVGAGAMGTVYEAHDTALDRSVAVKVLKSEIAADEEIVVRFQREARAAAKVNHPNLTHIYFVGEQDGHHFFAMEYLPGRTLEDVVKEDGPLPLENALDVLVQCARGLGAAHLADVVHRDVKPSNIIMMPDATVKVTDFGLAKSLTGEADVTGAGRVMGTPRYMSPEQCRGESLDGRSDIYNLGLLMYFLLTGRNAFEGKTLGKVLEDQMRSKLPSLLASRPDLGPRAHRVLERLTEKDPAKRPPSMNNAIALLEELRPRTLDLAPIVSRGAAFLVDLLLITLVVSIGTGFFVIFLGLDPENANFRWAARAANAVLFLASQTGMEALVGGSAGKLLFSLRVVRRDGTRPALRPLLIRFLLRVPFFPFAFVPPALLWLDGFGWLLTLLAAVAGVICYFVSRKRTLSDILTGTRVIYSAPRHREWTGD